MVTEGVLERDGSAPASWCPTGPMVSLGAFLIVGVLYAAGAVLAWRSFGAADIGLSFFPPAGVTLAALVLLAPRHWPAVAAAVLIAEISVDSYFGLGLGVATGYGTANLIGAPRRIARLSKPARSSWRP